MDVTSTPLGYSALISNTAQSRNAATSASTAHSLDTAEVQAELAVPALPTMIPSQSQSLTPISTAPATIVTIGKSYEPPQVYEEPVVVNLLRDKSHSSPAATTTSQALLNSFTLLSEKKATFFSVSSMFSQVGALSRETNEYRNEVRKFYLPKNITTEKFEPNFSNSAGVRAESVFLTVKTRDGDSIQIQFSRNMSGRETSQMAFSFLVDGELSEKEQNDLEKLTAKLGAVGDEFFRVDTTELRGLKDVDTDSIRSFKFILQRPDPVNKTYVEHTYEFSIDEATQTRHLVATDVRGYSVDIKSQLQTLTKNSVLDIKLFQQYIDLIIQATDDSDTPNASKRFMLDAFESMFSEYFFSARAGQEQAHGRDGGGQIDGSQIEENRAEDALAAFDSGMPDFDATFRSPVFHNPNYYAQVESMVLTLEQHTRVEEKGHDVLVKQESSYRLIDHSFENFSVNTRDDFENLGGGYTYSVVQEAGSISRFLSMTNDVVNNIWIEQDADKAVRKTRFENYKLVDEDAYAYADRRIQEFSELLRKYNANNQHLAVEDLLFSSKEKLFLTI